MFESRILNDDGLYGVLPLLVSFMTNLEYANGMSHSLLVHICKLSSLSCDAFLMDVQADEALVMQSSVLYNKNPSLHLVITLFHTALHKEIETFCLQVGDSFENLLDLFSLNMMPFLTIEVFRLVIFHTNEFYLIPSLSSNLRICVDPHLAISFPKIWRV